MAAQGSIRECHDRSGPGCRPMRTREPDTTMGGIANGAWEYAFRVVRVGHFPMRCSGNAADTAEDSPVFEHHRELLKKKVVESLPSHRQPDRDDANR